MFGRNKKTDYTKAIQALSDRYHVPSQEVSRWIEQGYAMTDLEWAYRFAETSPESDVASMLTMRRQGQSWDDIHNHIRGRGEQNPSQQAEGKKLVPGGERQTSRYFYRDNAPMLDKHAGTEHESGYEGSPEQNEKNARDQGETWKNEGGQ